jgi:hypothetical protein
VGVGDSSRYSRRQRNTSRCISPGRARKRLFSVRTLRGQGHSRKLTTDDQ